MKNLANKLGRMKARMGGWSSDKHIIDFMEDRVFYCDYEDSEKYRVVMENGNCSISLPKGKDITEAGFKKIRVGVQFPVVIKVKVLKLNKRLKEFQTQSETLPTKEDFYNQIGSEEHLVIENDLHTITINKVFYRFPGEIYKMLNKIPVSKVIDHKNNTSTGFVGFNLLNDNLLND